MINIIIIIDQTTIDTSSSMMKRNALKISRKSWKLDGNNSVLISIKMDGFMRLRSGILFWTHWYNLLCWEFVDYLSDS
jgi:hypothetical protein